MVSKENLYRLVWVIFHNVRQAKRDPSLKSIYTGTLFFKGNQENQLFWKFQGVLLSRTEEEIIRWVHNQSEKLLMYSVVLAIFSFCCYGIFY